MSQWFRFYGESLNDPKVQRLPGDVFRAKFIAAMNGEQNEFSRWMSRPRSFRLPAKQWGEIRKRIFARDDFTCQYCGVRGAALECDHVQPHSRGGSDDDENLVTACKPCNRAKGSKTLEEWGHGAD